jgi:N-acyl-D-amino-acid deacylase
MDIIIKNGMVIDGTGAPGYKADLLIKGNTIQKIGENLNEEDYEIIDASNRVISPGFIDMHNHGDLSILNVNRAEATLMQGCTTLVVGVCGLGLAPANKVVKFYYGNFVSKTFGLSGMNVYNTLHDYFDEIEKQGIATNLAFFAPQGNIRLDILGIEERPADQKELARMKETLEKCMEDGAFGLSTGLIYPPGSITQTEEIIELCKVVKKYNGIYDSHMRNEGTGVVSEGMAEIIRIAKETGVQCQISHWKAGTNFAWKLTPLMIETMQKAREDGVNIYSDMYPYEEGSTSLTGILLKTWVYGNFNKNLTDPETRKRIVDEVFDLFISNFLQDMPGYIKILPKGLLKKLIIIGAKKLVRVVSVKHNQHVEGLKLGKVLKMLYPKRKLVDALLDFMRDEEGSIMISFKQMSEKKSIFELIKQDFVCIGSDGFLVIDKNTHPRSYGCFPKILGDYVREKGIFSLEEGIWKMTGLTASILGLKDRGFIKPNYKADIVIFDPETIIDTSTYSNGRQFPKGIDYVIVNGEITVKYGKHLGVLNGQILKHRK